MTFPKVAHGGCKQHEMTVPINHNMATHKKHTSCVKYVFGSMYVLLTLGISFVAGSSPIDWHTT